MLKACYFGQPEINLYQVFLYVFIISALACPLVKLKKPLCLRATKQPWFTVSPYRPLDRALNRVLHWLYQTFLEKAPPKPKKNLTNGELEDLISQKMATEKRAVTISANGPMNKVVPFDGGSDNGNNLDESLENEAAFCEQNKDQPKAIVANTASVVPSAGDGPNGDEETKDIGSTNITSVGTPQANLAIDLSGGGGDAVTDNEGTGRESATAGPYDVPTIVLPTQQVNKPASPQPGDSSLSPSRRNSNSSTVGASAKNTARGSDELATSLRCKYEQNLVVLLILPVVMLVLEMEALNLAKLCVLLNNLHVPERNLILFVGQRPATKEWVSRRLRRLHRSPSCDGKLSQRC